VDGNEIVMSLTRRAAVIKFVAAAGAAWRAAGLLKSIGCYVTRRPRSVYNGQLGVCLRVSVGVWEWSCMRAVSYLPSGSVKVSIAITFFCSDRFLKCHKVSAF